MAIFKTLFIRWFKLVKVKTNEISHVNAPYVKKGIIFTWLHVGTFNNLNHLILKLNLSNFYCG